MKEVPAMETMLGAIEVGKIPWMVLMFALANWKTAVAAVWGLGFAVILIKRMKQWYKDDARDGAVGQKDEDQIFVNMKTIAKQRRPERTKQILKYDLFWMPWMAFNGGRKLARVIFYPLLVQLDKAQTEGLEEGRKGPKGPQKAPLTILIEGENASKCIGCGAVVAHTDPHGCSRPLEVLEEARQARTRVVKEKYVDCSGCGHTVEAEKPHECTALLEQKGLTKCSCGTTYKDDGDFEHVCPEESVSANTAQCHDCGRGYDPTLEVHAATSCKGCGDVHCKRHDCGERV
jgi:hypothetical protein